MDNKETLSNELLEVRADLEKMEAIADYLTEEYFTSVGEFIRNTVNEQQAGIIISHIDKGRIFGYMLQDYTIKMQTKVDQIAMS